jgi:hypothetical protein
MLTHYLLQLYNNTIRNVLLLRREKLVEETPSGCPFFVALGHLSFYFTLLTSAAFFHVFSESGVLHEMLMLCQTVIEKGT